MLISVLSQFLGDVVPHSGLCEFHSCALCREVSHHGLIAKIPLCHLHLRYCFCHCLRFKIIGKDQNIDRFKNWQFYGAGLSFCDHRAISLMKNCVIFSNPSINLIAPPSVIRKYHYYALEFLHLLQCIPLTCGIHCLWFVERYNTSVVLVLIFILAWSHTAENWSSACWRPCWEDASNTKSSEKLSGLNLQLTNVTPGSTRLWLSIQLM